MNKKSVIYIVITIIILLILALFYRFLSINKKLYVENLTENKKWDNNIIQNEKQIEYIDTEITYDKNEKWYFSYFYKDGTLKEEWILYWETGEFVIYSKDSKIIWTWEIDAWGKICNIDWCSPYPMIRDWRDVKYYDDESIQSISEIKDFIPSHTTYYFRDWRFMWELEYREYLSYSWVEYTFHDNWQIEGEAYYKEWKKDWRSYWYYEDWSKSAERLYNNWIIKKGDGYDKNWKLEWSHKYDDQGNIREEHYYKDWILEKIWFFGGSGYDDIIRKESYNKDWKLYDVQEYWKGKK